MGTGRGRDSTAGGRTMPALVLSTFDFANTSQIAVLFTRDLGKVRGLAKGSKRPTGSFQGGLDPGSLYSLGVIPRTEGLDLLTRAEMEESFSAVRRATEPLNAAFYVLELTAELTVEHDPQPGFFDAVIRALRLLDRGAPRDIVLFAFEAEAIRLLGFMPRTDECAICGEPAGARPSFSPRFGGALCSRCAPRDPGGKPVSAGALKTMARLAEGAIPIESLNVEGRTGRELRAAFDLFWLNLFGRELRTARFLRRAGGGL